MNSISITRVVFKNFKALENYSVSLRNMNILVGPNNSGKSTILNAFRVLAAGLRRAYARQSETVPSPSGHTRGHFIATDDIPMSFENVHTNYETERPSTIDFSYSNGNVLTLYFPPDGRCVLFPSKVTRAVASPSTFRNEFPTKVNFIPVLGPLEHNEPRVEKVTVQRNLPTHRASRNFRNYWRYFPEHFDEFALLLRNTWPGMEIAPPEIISLNTVAMFCHEDRIPRELYWAGFGFQVWCQLLTHIIRAKDADLLIVDEPEIYLHPDLQRQLLSIFRDSGPNILLATHSTEIISEADPDEILSIIKSRRSATRLKSINEVQNAIELLGSNQNITLTKLARTRRVLFVEGTDFKILSRFAKVLDLPRVANQSDFTVVPTDGFSQWPKLQALEWGFGKTLGEKLVLGAVFDRDYRCDEEIENILLELKTSLKLAHFHRRKELENYLLVPRVLDRAIRSKSLDIARRKGREPANVPASTDILSKLTEPVKAAVQGKYIDERVRFFQRSHLHGSTITTETIEVFEQRWGNINERMEIVPGKATFRDLNRHLQEIYGFSLTPLSVIASFHKIDVPSDLSRFLRQIDTVFRSTDN